MGRARGELGVQLTGNVLEVTVGGQVVGPDADIRVSGYEIGKFAYDLAVAGLTAGSRYAAKARKVHRVERDANGKIVALLDEEIPAPRVPPLEVVEVPSTVPAAMPAPKPKAPVGFQPPRKRAPQ
jgi:hypothetical protein